MKHAVLSQPRVQTLRAGWEHVKMYAVLPDLRHPQLIYAEGCVPNEELASRFFPMYHSTDTIFLVFSLIYGITRWFCSILASTTAIP